MSYFDFENPKRMQRLRHQLLLDVLGGMQEPNYYWRAVQNLLVYPQFLVEAVLTMQWAQEDRKAARSR